MPHSHAHKHLHSHAHSLTHTLSTKKSYKWPEQKWKLKQKIQLKKTRISFTKFFQTLLKKQHEKMAK